MEGSNYEDKCSQWANDMGRMSNREKRKEKSKRKRIGVNHNRDNSNDSTDSNIEDQRHVLYKADPLL